ncbi:glycosyltransferase family protein [Lacinutrix venerupis]|uniref:UDP-glycosyltransferase n=1 Tax=Lacinutrix venerupis TaxID=1486034 RepID=A0AAC9PX43_9FLAO|nr:hypothetical protein [Lacinutrix venerupis]APY00731.1 hypothetical protein BWR22_10540 [Lacinutrix venerupis]
MSTKKNILVIAESIDVNATSGAKANVALINALLLCNYSVTVLHYTRKKILLSQINCIKIEEEKSSLNYFLSRAQRVFQRATKINISKSLENIFGHSFTFYNDSKSIANATKKYYNNHDLIITLSQGASFRPHHAMLSLPSLHSKWLAYVHDPYPFHLYPEPYNWVEAGYKQKELFFRKVSESAKYSAFPSQLLKEWMGQFYPKFLETGLVIPHQNSKFKNLNYTPLDYFNSKKFTLLHAGNLMMPRSPIGLIEGFKIFLKKHPEAKKEVKLLMLGNADYYKHTLNDYNKNIKELYVSDGYVSFNEVYKLQKQVSINIIIEAKSYISPFLPGKFPHCVEANKPILHLGPRRSETRRLLGENYRYFCTIDDSKKIAELIEELYIIWKTNKKELRLNRKDLETYLSPTQLESILRTIV